MKRILIIGDADSVWIKRYIEHILLGEDYEVYLTNLIDKTKFSKFYSQNHIHLINTKSIPILRNIPKIRALIRLFSAFRERRHYDIIHVHYMSPIHIAALRILASHRKTSHIIGTFWGSDLFRASARILKVFRRNFRHFRYLGVSTDEMQRKFTDIFGDSYNQKLRRVLFGISGFNDISTILKVQNKENCKAHFNICSKKTVVCVGYNAYEGQQHLKVISQIAKIREETLKKIIWIFPMTYGKMKNLKEVQDTLSLMDVNYIILTNFMEDEEIAKLRIATDILIHAQITDAFSASLQEHLYAGSVVINPTWIQYSQISKLQIDIVEYSEFDELPEIIEKLLQNGVQCLGENQEKLENLSSWRSVKDSWRRLYEV